MTVEVTYSDLIAASHEWSDQGDDLAAAERSLDLADVGLLSERVRGEMQNFLKTWGGEVRDLREQAVEHGESLAAAAQTWQLIDEQERERLRPLLPFARPTAPDPETPIRRALGDPTFGGPAL